MAKIFDTLFAQNGDREVVPIATTPNGRVSINIGFGVDYEKDLKTDPNAKDVERKKLNYMFYLLMDGINKAAETGGGDIIGVPIPYPSYYIPAGYIPYDGRRFDTNTNPGLAALFPTGYLPDLRGVAIRGLDAGRGLDPGRGLLTYQDDAMQQITGQFQMDDQAVTIGNPPSGVFYADVKIRYDAQSNGNFGGYLVKFDSARQTKVAAETRMKNMAFYYITKAG